MSESSVSNFLKNNMWGILFFSLVTGVIGNYIYDTLKNKGLLGKKEEPLTNKIDKLISSKHNASAVEDIFKTIDLNGIEINNYVKT